MEPSDFFTQLGLRYRRRRIEQRIKLRTLAARCALSIDTLRAIEQGSERVKMGSWLTVAEALGLAESWQGLLAEEIDPFAEYDHQRATQERLRKTRVRS